MATCWYAQSCVCHEAGRDRKIICGQTYNYLNYKTKVLQEFRNSGTALKQGAPQENKKTTLGRRTDFASLKGLRRAVVIHHTAFGLPIS